MTDSDELPDELVERMLVRRVASDLVKHSRYSKHGDAITDSRQLIDLHRRGRDSMPAFTVKRLARLESRYSDVTGQSIESGLAEAREDLADVACCIFKISSYDVAG